MSFTQTNTFEFATGEVYGGQRVGVVIVATVSIGLAGVGPYLSFNAEQRGTTVDPDNGTLGGYTFTRRLSSGPTVYAYELLRSGDRDQEELGSLLMGIGDGDITGKYAGMVVGRALFRDREWIEEMKEAGQLDESAYKAITNLGEVVFA